MPKHKKKSEKKSEGSESSSASESPSFYKKMQEKLERYIRRHGALTNTENNTKENDRSEILTGPQNINPIPSTSSAQNPGEIIADCNNSDQDTDDDLPLGSEASTIRQTIRTMEEENSSNNDPMCVICHDWIKNGRENILLPCCKLTTHKHCLKEWKDKGSRPFRFLDQEMVSCPHCRQEFWSTHSEYKALFAELNAPNIEDTNRGMTVNIPDDTNTGFTYAGEKSPRGRGFADDDSVIIDSEILNTNRPSSSRLYQIMDQELRRANDSLARSSEAINRANKVYAPSLPQLETESQSVVMVSHVFRGTPKGGVNYSNNEQNSVSNNTTTRTTSTTTTTATSTPATDTSTSPPNDLATSTTRATSRKSNNKSSKRTSTTTTRVTGRGKKIASPKPSCSKQNNGTTKTIKQKCNEALTEHQDDSSNEGDMLLYSPDHPSSPTMAQPVDDELLDSPSESDTPTAYKTEHEADPKKGKKSYKPDATPGSSGAIRKTHNVAVRIRSPVRREHSNTGSSYRAAHRSPQRAVSNNPNPRHHESSPEQSTSRAGNKNRTPMKGEPSKTGGISRVTHIQRSPLRADINILKRRNNDSNECTKNCCNHNQRPRLEAQERRSEAPRYRNSPQYEIYMQTKHRIEIDRQNGLSEMEIIKKVFKWNLSSQNSPAGHIPERYESCRYFNFGICSNDVTLKDNIPGCLSGQRQVWRVHGCNWCRAHIHVISYHMEEHCILKQMMG